MKRLTAEQIIMLHEILIKHTGGLDGIRDQGLLESAVYAPFHSFDGIAIFPTIEKKAARLGFGLVKNHAFVDGNKRIGILAMLSFLEMNGVALHCTDEELVQLGLGLAEGTIDENMLIQFIIDRN